MELINFIKNNSNWEELLANKPYCIKITRDDGYIIFKYSQIDSDFSNVIVKECRGLILREFDFKPVCVPFYKFMNAEEPESDLNKIDWSTASTQTKVDGSLTKVWNDNGKWHISTNGTIDAFKADLQSLKYKSFGDLFLAALPVSFEEFTSVLDKNKTYMFELISPYNRVVIPYDTTELYFLGVRDNNTLLETMPEYDELAKKNWFKIPPRFPLHSYKDVANAANELNWDHEGFVVCDKNFNRVKIKSPSYVKAHFLRTNNSVSYEHLLEIILTGEKSEFLVYADDFKEELECVENAYNSIIKEVKEAIKELNPDSFSSRKEYALEVLKRPTWMQSFLFKYQNIDEFIKAVRVPKWIEIMKIRGDINE